ncbi:MAG: hypothetical protein ABI548_27115 [Polyangiaceae bacterium]
MIRLARMLRRLADYVDPPAPVATAPGEQRRVAQRLCDDITLQRALRDSLRRYSPAEQPGQA